jgi:hypothetical protein
VGIVTGKRLTGLEERLRAGGDEGTIVVPDEYELRVLIRRTLKGCSKTTIDVPIVSCGSGSAELMENIVVFVGHDGMVLRPREETLKALRDTPKDGIDRLR